MPSDNFGGTNEFIKVPGPKIHASKPPHTGEKPQLTIDLFSFSLVWKKIEFCVVDWCL